MNPFSRDCHIFSIIGTLWTRLSKHHQCNREPIVQLGTIVEMVGRMVVNIGLTKLELQERGAAPQHSTYFLNFKTFFISPSYMLISQMLWWEMAERLFSAFIFILFFSERIFLQSSLSSDSVSPHRYWYSLKKSRVEIILYWICLSWSSVADLETYLLQYVDPVFFFLELRSTVKSCLVFIKKMQAVIYRWKD